MYTEICIADRILYVRGILCTVYIDDVHVNWVKRYAMYSDEYTYRYTSMSELNNKQTNSTTYKKSVSINWKAKTQVGALSK